MGEPGGIGPEVAAAAYRTLGGAARGRRLRLVGDAGIFRTLGVVDDGAIVPVGFPVRARTGIADTSNTPAVIAAIDEAVAWALDGRAAAVVTAPIHKASLMQGGFRFAGHTEYLQHLTRVPRAVMMLAGPDLRVVPLTIHIPLAEIPARITIQLIVETVEIVLRALSDDFRIPDPRLAVAGLNPHAGEDGQIGTTEKETIRPACDALRRRGLRVAGPLSADTMFHAEARSRYDAALCMYHDQALIPLKTIAFWEGVNVTLGLPIVRTSPDHGAALDIAGTGRADPRSMIAAIELAARIADARNR
jgi:4-hydroxythreonine-4-phosphate dehydrogenase